MSNDQIAYFEVRAEAEIAAAHGAVHPDAAKAHYLLAAYYLDRVHNKQADGDPQR